MAESTEQYAMMIKMAMLQLQDVLGLEDFGNLQQLMHHIDGNFNQLIFEGLEADKIEELHHVAQATALMMDMIRPSAELM